jgi:curved DNA-binding protein CbpA
MSDQSHYAVLGLAKSARPDEILRAFVGLAHSFGPDAYAGQELGPFLGKLEAILQRIGDAYAALSNDRLRQEYDGYLARSEVIAAWEANMAPNAASLDNMAHEHEAAALYEERHQEWEKAARSWTRVYETRPDDASCARHAGRALIKAKRDLRRAQAFVERAVLLDPHNPLNHRLLARIFVESGLRRRARQQLQLANKLEQNRRETAAS